MFPLVPYHALAQAARGRQGRLPAALSVASWPPGARSFRRVLPPGEGPGLLRRSVSCSRDAAGAAARRALRSSAARRRRGCRGLDRGLRGGRPGQGGRRSASTTARRPSPSTATARASLYRHRRHVHPRQHPSGRRPRAWATRSSAQAQRALQTWRTVRPRARPACRGLRDVSGRRAPRAALPERASPRRRRRPRAEDAAASAWSATAAWPRSSRNSSSSRRMRRRQVDFTPGDYLQFDIPRVRRDPLPRLRHPAAVRGGLGAAARLRSRRSQPAAGPAQQLLDRQQSRHGSALLRFNVRIATPPPGQDCPPGVGSAYVFSLKPGDTVTAIGPFGDFHIKPTQKEMVYIGGGAGMAPLRAHLSHLFETERTGRRVSFWYGARSRQEIFYQDYFEGLASPVLELPLPFGAVLAASRRTTGPVTRFDPRSGPGAVPEIARERPGGRVLSLRPAPDDCRLPPDAGRSRRGQLASRL